MRGIGVCEKREVLECAVEWRGDEDGQSVWRESGVFFSSLCMSVGQI